MSKNGIIFAICCFPFILLFLLIAALAIDELKELHRTRHLRRRD